MSRYFSGQFKKENGKLAYADSKVKLDLEDFVKTYLREGEHVEVFMEPESKDKATKPQLAKIHKMIRVISMDSGNSFGDIKNEVKLRCINIKSFKDYSVEEMTLAIQETRDLAEDLGIFLS